MRVLCLRQQIEGYRDVESGPPDFGVGLSSGERSTIEQHCTNQWPDDFWRRAYCQTAQVEALSYTKSGAPSGVASSSWQQAVSRCQGEWPTDFRMRAYCVKRSFD